MSRIQEEVTSYSWELLLRFLGLGGEVLSNIEHAGEFVFDKAEEATKGVLTLLIKNARQKAGKDAKGESDDVKVLTAMQKRAQKNNEILRDITVADEDATDVIKRLKESNVLFIARDIEGDNAKLILFLSGDEATVEKAVRSVMADRGLITEIDANEFIDTRLKNGVGTVDGLNDVELEAFREYARNERLPFAKVTSSKDHNIIIYEPEKANELKRVLSAAVWALSGRQGKELHKGLDAKIRARKELYAAIEDGKEHVIVSAKNKGHYIIIDNEGATLYKNDKKIQNVSRENILFLEKALQMSDGLDTPVVLNKGEYAINGTRDERVLVYHEELVKQRTKERVPKQELDDLFEKENERRRLIEEKMALDDENQNPFWIFDSSYSYSEATTHEQIDDDDDERRKEQEKIEAASRRLKALSIEEIGGSTSRGLDAIIAKAEQRRNERMKQEKEETRQEDDRGAFSKITTIVEK